MPFSSLNVDVLLLICENLPPCDVVRLVQCSRETHSMSKHLLPSARELHVILKNTWSKLFFDTDRLGELPPHRMTPQYVIAAIYQDSRIVPYVREMHLMLCSIVHLHNYVVTVHNVNNDIGDDIDTDNDNDNDTREDDVDINHHIDNFSFLAPEEMHEWKADHKAGMKMPACIALLSLCRYVRVLKIHVDTSGQGASNSTDLHLQAYIAAGMQSYALSTITNTPVRAPRSHDSLTKLILHPKRAIEGPLYWGDLHWLIQMSTLLILEMSDLADQPDACGGHWLDAVTRSSSTIEQVQFTRAYISADSLVELVGSLPRLKRLSSINPIRGQLHFRNDRNSCTYDPRYDQDHGDSGLYFARCRIFEKKANVALSSRGLDVHVNSSNHSILICKKLQPHIS